MNFPLVQEYIEAIKSAADNFEELSCLKPVLGDDGLPVMTSGNFAVVFKMKDEQSGKFYAVKCFTKEQEGRAEAYRKITKELRNVSSPYLVSIRYLEKELFVDTDQTMETEFPVLLMDWVEGKTLDKYLREILQKRESKEHGTFKQTLLKKLEEKHSLEMLAFRFSQLAQWLIPQPFAHGDLKPDNILVREDGSLVLVDYDGMYVPTMKGQKARELGSPDFRHPLRTENDFDEHIDDFSFISILLSLVSISIVPKLLEDFGAEDRLLFSATDYHDIENSAVYSSIPNIVTSNTNYKSLFKNACKSKSFSLIKSNNCILSPLQEPPQIVETYIAITKAIDDPFQKMNNLQLTGNLCNPNLRSSHIHINDDKEDKYDDKEGIYSLTLIAWLLVIFIIWLLLR